MLTRLLTFIRMHKKARLRTDNRPCAICGLAPKIRLSSDGNNYGRYCLYYGLRVPPEELNNVHEGLRLVCREDGNHFTWPVIGVTPKDLLDWRMDHMDRHFHRKVLVWGVLIGVATILVTALGIWVEANTTITILPDH